MAMIMSKRPIPQAWAELGTPGGSKHAASPSVSGRNVSAPLSRHYTVSRLCHQCGTAQPSTSTSAYGTISLPNPNDEPSHISAYAYGKTLKEPLHANYSVLYCTNIITISSKILPTIWRFKEGSGPVIEQCICNLSPCSPPCLSESCLPIPLCSVLSGQDVRINVATDSGECASSDQECPAVWVIVICDAAIRDRTDTTAVCNLNGDGWSDSMGSHTWVDIIVSGFLSAAL